MATTLHPKTRSGSACVELAKCRWFDIEGFDVASAASEDVNSALLWRAIRVDVLGPIKAQLQSYQKLLMPAYQSFCDVGYANPPIRKRFRYELTGKLDDDGRYVTDGSFLKGMVICAQLAQHGLDDNDIVRFLCNGTNPGVKDKTVSSVRRDWDLSFSDRVIKYREEARAFVKGGYRWLVHAEKP